jgi:hypothetical protein
MVLTVGDQIYIVEGSGSDSETYAFLVLPMENATNIRSPDLASYNQDNGGVNSLLDGEYTRASFLVALKGLFDDQTYGTGDQAITITSPKVYEVTQTQTDITPS